MKLKGWSKVSASVGVGSAETTTKFEFEQTFSYGQSKEESTAVERSWTIPFIAEANAVTTAYVAAYEANVTAVPFTYDVVLYEIENQLELERARIKKTAKFDGSILSNEINAAVENRPINAGEIELYREALLAH